MMATAAAVRFGISSTKLTKPQRMSRSARNWVESSRRETLRIWASLRSTAVRLSKESMGNCRKIAKALSIPDRHGSDPVD